MHKYALLLATSLSVCPAAFGQPATPCVAGVPKYAASVGGFGVLGGKLYSPDGVEFVPHGMNIMGGDRPSAAQILSEFPGTNFVRLPISSSPPGQYPDVSKVKAYVDDLTSHGIFVEIEDHTSSNGGNRGGGYQGGTIFTGDLLQKELDAYKSWASTFKDNPYVGFGTTNEPSNINAATGQKDPAGMSRWQGQIYDAIRSAGNNGVVWFQVDGWADPKSFGAGVDLSVYKKATNAALEVHIYPWLFNPSASQGQVDSTLASYLDATRQIKSADGDMPILVGEFGNSTTGDKIDPNWEPVVKSVLNSGAGTAAWAWGKGYPGDGLHNPSTNYGALVKAHNATSNAVGCAVSPIPVMATNNQAINDAQKALTDANNLSVSDVATLATQGMTADGQSLTNQETAAGGQTLTNQGLSTDGQSLEETYKIAAETGPSAGGVLPTDQTTIDALAQGAMDTIEDPARTVGSPSGTMPAPERVATSSSFSATGDYGTSVAPNSNNTGTISGTGNVVAATGGEQTMTITGIGNTITLGAYNDTVNVQTAGNNIDMGSGSDTLNLTYKGAKPSSIINEDVAALSPLASAGNKILLPAPGMGTLTINGVLAKNDRIDLTRALSGTTWNHKPETMWGYVTAASSAQGCIISVDGKIIAILPNGSPSGDIGSFLVAQ